MATKWTDGLSKSAYERLANRRTIKADIPALMQAKWNQIKHTPGFTKEDALVSILELLNRRD